METKQKNQNNKYLHGKKLIKFLCKICLIYYVLQKQKIQKKTHDETNNQIRIPKFDHKKMYEFV